MRKKLIAGNWKMNILPSEAGQLLDTIKNGVKNADSDVLLLMPSIDLFVALDSLRNTNVKYGAENFYCEDSGAYTGEISADMIKDVGGEYVIVGHSERRNIFGEDDVLINKKLKKALDKDLIPVLCVGEDLECREDNKVEDFIGKQIKLAFAGINKDEVKKVVVAYEPIWAIGTGKTATAEIAEAVCKFIRETIASLYDSETAEVVRILYGGSVNASTAKDLFEKPNIDGGLVGKASLSEEFIKIVCYK